MEIFSRRSADLEIMNRILTDSARQKAQRVEELEQELAATRRQLTEETHRIAKAESRREDAERLSVSYAAVIKRLEASRANSEARLQDAERKNECDSAAGSAPRKLGGLPASLRIREWLRHRRTNAFHLIRNLILRRKRWPQARGQWPRIRLRFTLQRSPSH